MLPPPAPPRQGAVHSSARRENVVASAGRWLPLSPTADLPCRRRSRHWAAAAPAAGRFHPARLPATDRPALPRVDGARAGLTSCRRRDNRSPHEQPQGGG
jgi:hypothetical protein